MHTRRWLVCGLAAAGILGVGCGDGGAPSGPLNSRLGDSDAGTPFGVYDLDPGLLEDQSSYNPVAIPKPGGGGGGGGAAAGSGDVQAEVLALVDGMLKALLECDVDTFLEAFSDAEIALLKEDTSALIDACDKVTTLVKVAGSKLGREGFTIRDLLKEVQSMPGVPPIVLEASALFEVTAVDAENASMKFKAIPPGMMGGASGGDPPPVAVKKVGNDWKIQVPKAMTADDLEQMKEGLKKAGAFLDKLTAEIEKSTATTLPELVPIVMATWGAYQLEQGAGEGAVGNDNDNDNTAETPEEEPASGILGPDGQPVNPRAGGGAENTNDNGG